MASLADSALTVIQIVVVNLILSGDNALVIGLTAQQLPAGLRRPAVLWGSGLAVLLQAAFAIIVGWLLEVPGLRLAGALALILIARKLTACDVENARREQSTRSVLSAILAIVVANVAMSFDNVLAVGALSHGLPALIGLGLFVSAAMLLTASSLVVVVIERYRWVTTAGAGLLACTAAGLICEEPLLAETVSRTAKTAAATVEVPVSDEATPAAPMMHATTHPVPGGIAPKWTCAIYGMALSLCFGNLRWWGAIRRFERERTESTSACAPESS